MHTAKSFANFYLCITACDVEVQNLPMDLQLLGSTAVITTNKIHADWEQALASCPRLPSIVFTRLVSPELGFS